MKNPCENCGKRNGCTRRCFSRKDYDRGMKKRARR